MHVHTCTFTHTRGSIPPGIHAHVAQNSKKRGWSSAGRQGACGCRHLPSTHTQKNTHTQKRGYLVGQCLSCDLCNVSTIHCRDVQIPQDVLGTTQHPCRDYCTENTWTHMHCMDPRRQADTSKHTHTPTHTNTQHGMKIAWDYRPCPGAQARAGTPCPRHCTPGVSPATPLPTTTAL